MEVAELDVDDSNPTRAIELYKRVGFSVHFKKLIYQKELD